MSKEFISLAESRKQKLTELTRLYFNDFDDYYEAIAELTTDINEILKIKGSTINELTMTSEVKEKLEEIMDGIVG